jgi:hypothetical protein
MIWTYQPYKNPIAKRFWILVGLGFLLIGNGLAFYRLMDDPSRLAFSSGTFSLAVLFFMLLMLRKPRYYYIEDDTIYSMSKRVEFSEIDSFWVDRDNLLIKLKIKDPSFYKLSKLYFDKLEDLKKVEEKLKKGVG